MSPVTLDEKSQLPGHSPESAEHVPLHQKLEVDHAERWNQKDGQEEFRPCEQEEMETASYLSWGVPPGDSRAAPTEDLKHD